MQLTDLELAPNPEKGWTPFAAENRPLSYYCLEGEMKFSRKLKMRPDLDCEHISYHCPATISPSEKKWPALAHYFKSVKNIT